MNILQSIVLGAAQGLTEFLPVSSSGHMKLIQKLFGMTTDSITLEVLMHLGTLIAVIIVYWRDLWNMVCHPIHSNLKWLVVATLPAVVVRLLYTNLFVKLTSGTGLEGFFVAVRDNVGSFMDTAFEGGFLGWAFLITSVFLLAGEWFSTRIEKHHKKMKGGDALTMGVMQAIAVLPGISRSGATIAGGRARGLTSKRSTDFAFQMSIPAILGAVVMDGKDILTGEVAESISLLPLALGVLTAGVFGFLAIRFMISIAKKISLKWFALYTGILGILVLIDQYITKIYF